LIVNVINQTEDALFPHLTKSARLSAYSGLLEKLDTSSSAIEAELDRWDHLLGAGGGNFEDSHLRA